MKRRILLVVFAGVALVAIFFVFILLKSKPASSQVRIGYVSTGISGLCVEIMKDQRLPEKYGLQVEYVGFIDPSAMNNAFVVGSFDINIAAGANVVAVARTEGHRVQYFFPSLLNSVSVVVRTDSKSKSLNDLKGKKVGWYGLQSGGGTGFYVIAREHSIYPQKEFNLIEAKPPALWSLLEKGELEAITVYEPFVSRMLATGKFRELLGPFWREWKNRTGKVMEMSGMAASEEWLNKNPEMAKKVILMWCEAARFIQSNPRKILAKYSKFTQLESDQERILGAERIPPILATSWEGIDASIAETLQMLATDQVLIKSVPEGTIRRID